MRFCLDPLNDPPIFAKPKDLRTAEAVTSLTVTEQGMLLNVAASVVNISSITPGKVTLLKLIFCF